MKTEWDYSSLAKAYLKRPNYSPSVLDSAFEMAQLSKGSLVCDVGAGVAHLTIPMLERGFRVDAVEPNDEMRKWGILRTENAPNVSWFEGTGENTNRDSSKYDAVTFGSSFNVTDRVLALKEVKRISKPNGWFICMWNHRDLADPVQARVEDIIKTNIPDYNYGTRREDQTKVINDSNLFGKIEFLEGPINHEISVADYMEAWRSHATLHRQAGAEFEALIQKIEDFCLQASSKGNLLVPYTTRLWMAKLKN